jgi:hypothetical protein
VDPKKMLSEMLKQWSFVPSMWADQLGYLRDRIQLYGSVGTFTTREINKISRAYKVFNYYRGPRFVSGGAPSLGKRSSKQFDRSGLNHVNNDNDDEKVKSPVETIMGMDPINVIDIMLKHQKYLTPSNLKWVQNIDKTVAKFDGTTKLTERQRKVIEDIFRKYRQKGGPIR